MEFELAICYETGDGVDVDIREAIRWYIVRPNQMKLLQQRRLLLNVWRGLSLLALLLLFTYDQIYLTVLFRSTRSHLSIPVTTFQMPLNLIISQFL